MYEEIYFKPYLIENMHDFPVEIIKQDVHIMRFIIVVIINVFLYPDIGPGFSQINERPANDDDVDEPSHLNSPSRRQDEYERLGGRAGSS